MLNFADPVRAVLAIFGVVVGVALEFFIRKPLEGEEKNLPKGLVRDVVYFSAFTALVSLALRFVIGSEIHLNHTYVAHGTPEDYLKFLRDICFLVLFGALLVKVALSKDLREFTSWLIKFFLACIAWSLIECPKTEFGRWWLGLNLLQLVITLAFGGLMKWFVDKKTNPGPYKAILAALLAAFYFAIFSFDLRKLMEIR
jgi:hypothetical protein